jgi:hypothetical protein
MNNKKHINPDNSQNPKDTWRSIKKTHYVLMDVEPNGSVFYLGWRREAVGSQEFPRLFVIEMLAGDGAQYDNNLVIEGTMEEFAEKYQVKAIWRIALEDMISSNILRNQNLINTIFP